VKKKEIKKQSEDEEEDAEDSSSGNEDSSANVPEDSSGEDSDAMLHEEVLKVSKKRKLEPKSLTPSKAAKTQLKESPKKSKVQVNGDDENEEGGSNESKKCEIYFGNLPFSFNEPAIKNIFQECGEIISLKLIKEQHTGRFKGFGFMKFANEESVKKAMELNGKEIEGRNLKVVPGTNLVSKGKIEMKSVYFGNTPPDLNEKEIREVFKDCGQILKVRLLTNPHTGEFRRSGFVDFETAEGAKKGLKKNGDTIRSYEIKVSRPSSNQQEKKNISQNSPVSV